MRALAVPPPGEAMRGAARMRRSLPRSVFSRPRAAAAAAPLPPPLHAARSPSRRPPALRARQVPPRLQHGPAAASEPRPAASSPPPLSPLCLPPPPPPPSSSSCRRCPARPARIPGAAPLDTPRPRPAPAAPPGCGGCGMELPNGAGTPRCGGCGMELPHTAGTPRCGRCGMELPHTAGTPRSPPGPGDAPAALRGAQPAGAVVPKTPCCRALPQFKIPPEHPGRELARNHRIMARFGLEGTSKLATSQQDEGHLPPDQEMQSSVPPCLPPSSGYLGHQLCGGDELYHQLPSQHLPHQSLLRARDQDSVSLHRHRLHCHLRYN
ncbi:uncharacterized protein LOC141727181 [Zonotrichia albicollis]|uniref:uncharacterized protein LOC141727181 n=1 Tax=Zonotrichia albicollis TaxID=44394 RepID=UPI003D80BB24